MDNDLSVDPFGNLPEQKPIPAPKKKAPRKEITNPNDISTVLTSKLSDDITLSEDQRAHISGYMEKMRYGITGIAALECQGDECHFYSKCPLQRANIPFPVGDDCPVETALMDQWLEQFIAASGCTLDELTAYDLLIIQDIAYQQLLEVRAAMELADNPQIQVRTFMGTDPQDGSAMYTYSLNNLVTFREKSNKMKMKLLRELIATAKSKSDSERGQRDRSSETADRLRRIEDRLGKDAIKVVDAEFNVKSDES